jgi:hypothetical protein
VGDKRKMWVTRRERLRDSDDRKRDAQWMKAMGYSKKSIRNSYVSRISKMFMHVLYEN